MGFDTIEINLVLYATSTNKTKKNTILTKNQPNFHHQIINSMGFDTIEINLFFSFI